MFLWLVTILAELKEIDPLEFEKHPERKRQLFLDEFLQIKK